MYLFVNIEERFQMKIQEVQCAKLKILRKKIIRDFLKNPVNFIISFFLILNLFAAMVVFIIILQLLEKTIVFELNIVSGTDSYRIELEQVASFYFCEHFYKAFKEKRLLGVRILFVNLVFERLLDSGFCSRCLNNRIKQ